MTNKRPNLINELRLFIANSSYDDPPCDYSEPYLILALLTPVNKLRNFYFLFSSRASSSATLHSEWSCWRRRSPSLGTPATTSTPRWPRHTGTGCSTTSGRDSAATSSAQIFLPAASISRCLPCILLDISPLRLSLTSSHTTSDHDLLKAVNVVINFDFPKMAETYLHRIGRSGRLVKVEL